MAEDTHGMGIPVPADSTRIQDFPKVARAGFERVAEVLAGGMTEGQTATVERLAAVAISEKLDDATLVRGGTEGLTQEAAGGFIGDNDRLTDLVVDAAGNVPEFVMQRWAKRLGTDQAVKGAVQGHTTAAAGGFVGDNDRLTELVVDAAGNVPSHVLSRWAARMNIAVPDFVSSSLPIVTVGDSQTGAVYDNTRWPSVMADALNLPPSDVRNCGYPGETSVAIAAKMGAVPAVWPTGGTIPAAGPVDVILKDHVQMMLYWAAMPCTLAGVPGTLRRHPDQPGGTPSTDYPAQFTRTTAGTAVKVPPNAPFLPENFSLRGNMTILMVGRNNTHDIPRVLADTRALVENLTALDKKYLVLSQINGNTRLINEGLAADYGPRYLDVKSYLASRQAIADAGLTPTQADLDAIASGTVPPVFLTDAVHMNGTGLTRQGHFVAQHIIAKGWI